MDTKPITDAIKREKITQEEYDILTNCLTRKYSRVRETRLIGIILRTIKDDILTNDGFYPIKKKGR